MLETVNVDMTTTDGDTSGMPEQQHKVVTGCLTNGDKHPVVRSEDGGQFEEVDSQTLDGLSKKMWTTCHISKDRQKVSLDGNEETISALLKVVFVDEDIGNDQQKSSADEEDIEGGQKRISADDEDIKGGQQKVSADDEDIEGGQQKVSADDEDLEGGQQKVSADDEDIEGGQQKVSADVEDLEGGQQKVSADDEQIKGIDDETSHDVVKVKKGHTSGDRNYAVEVGVIVKDDGLETDSGPREGVEHEWLSPTDWETEETSDDNNNDNNDNNDDDAEVITVMVHLSSETDEEDVKQFAGNTMCDRGATCVLGNNAWRARSPMNGKSVPYVYNDMSPSNQTLAKDGRRNDGTRKRDRTDDVDMSSKFMLPYKHSIDTFELQQNHLQLQPNQGQLQQQNQGKLQQHSHGQLRQQNVAELQHQIQQLQQQVPLLQQQLQFLRYHQQQQAPEHRQKQFQEQHILLQLHSVIKQKQELLLQQVAMDKFTPIQPRLPLASTQRCQVSSSPQLSSLQQLDPQQMYPNQPYPQQLCPQQPSTQQPLPQQPSPQQPLSQQPSPQQMSPQLYQNQPPPQQLCPQQKSSHCQRDDDTSDTNMWTNEDSDDIFIRNILAEPVTKTEGDTIKTKETLAEIKDLPVEQTHLRNNCGPIDPNASYPCEEITGVDGIAPTVDDIVDIIHNHLKSVQVDPVELLLDINPNIRKKAERSIAALSLDELNYIDPKYGDNLLHLAVIHKGPAVLVALISRCLRENILSSLINAVNTLKQTPLYIATVMNLPEIVAYLLSHDANPNTYARVAANGLPTRMQGVLHCVARKGDVGLTTLTQLLHSPNVEIDKADSDGQTPLHCAMMTHGRQSPNGPIDSKDMIKLLISHGANLNKEDGKSGKTPLHYAIERKDPDLLEFVLDLIPGNPAKMLNTPTYDGNCSLHIAVGLQMVDIEQHKKIVRLLMRHGADASHKNNSRHLPRELVANRNPEIINILRGVNTTSRTTSQSNPMLTTRSILLAYQYKPV